MLFRKIKSRNALTCPLHRSIIERQVGYETAEQLIASAAENLKKESDILSRIGDEQKAENTDLVIRFYASAAASYPHWLRSNFRTPCIELSPFGCCRSGTRPSSGTVQLGRYRFRPGDQNSGKF